MTNLGELPFFILEAAFTSLDFQDWLNLTLVNRYFQHLTVPLLFKNTSNFRIDYLNSYVKEDSRNKAQELKAKYSKYIKVALRVLNNPMFSIVDYENIKVYTENNPTSGHQLIYSDTDFLVYRKLLIYNLSLKYNKRIDNRILLNLYNLRSLSIHQFDENEFLIRELNCPNLTKFKLESNSISVLVINDIKESLPNLTCLKIYSDFYGTSDTSLPIFPKITEIDFKLSRQNPRIITKLLKNSAHWPNLEKYSVYTEYNQNFHFSSDWRKVWKVNTTLHSLDSSERISGIFNITDLKINFKIYQPNRLKVIFTNLVRLKKLNLVGCYYSSEFCVDNKLNLQVFQLESLYDFDQTFVYFLITLKLCSNISISYKNFNGQVFPIQLLNEVTFENLMYLKAPKSWEYFSECMKKRAPLLQ